MTLKRRIRQRLIESLDADDQWRVDDDSCLCYKDVRIRIATGSVLAGRVCISSFNVGVCRAARKYVLRRLLAEIDQW